MNVFRKIPISKQLSKLASYVLFLSKDLVEISVLLMIRLTDRSITWWRKHWFFPKFLLPLRTPSRKILTKIYAHDRAKNPNVSKVTLIDMSLKNLMFKKSRSLVTVGGMSIGIGAIVFLVSIGYGVQRLVVSNVARLEELKQADVITQPGSQIKITDETISNISAQSGVDEVLPMIAVVGRINFQNSETDMAVYGVTQEYLKQSAIQPSRGNVFESNDLVLDTSAKEGRVAGISTDSNEGLPEGALGKVTLHLEPEQWYRVRSEPSTKGKIIGYTKREVGQQVGIEVLGSTYLGGESLAHSDAEGEQSGKWIQSTFLIWDETGCTPNDGECEPGGYSVNRSEDGSQQQITGYIAELNLSVEAVSQGQVLGTSIDISDLVKSGVASAGAEIAITQLASESAALTESINEIPLGKQAVKEVVVNSAALTSLGLDPQDAVGTEFAVSFVVPADLLEDQTTKVQSKAAQYKIVGVIPDDSTPFIYVPFIDLRSLGITNYSQLKMVTTYADNLPSIRRLVESMGYVTTSVVDTIEQIDSLFASVKIVLGALGLVALTVASLGMFNTLTVSLLERTREVGLLKAIGMKSFEVRRLFITESLIMGFFGGVGGLIMGLLAGKAASLFISSLSISTKIQWLDVSYVPPGFIFAVFWLSVSVGILTGLYPAHRSRKISALDALRYE